MYGSKTVKASGMPVSGTYGNGKWKPVPWSGLIPHVAEFHERAQILVQAQLLLYFLHIFVMSCEVLQQYI